MRPRNVGDRQSPAQRMKQQMAFHPQLQEMVERLVPASYRWHPTSTPGGVSSTLWSGPSNWEGKSFTGSWGSKPVFAPGAGESVFFTSGNGYNLDCHVDVGVTVKDVTIPNNYTSQLVLDNPLTLSNGISTHDSAGGAIVGYSAGSKPARGILNITGMGRGTSLDWTGGHIYDVTVNVTDQANFFVSTLTFTRNMSGSDIYIGNGCALGWFSGPVNVTDPSKNSNIYIAQGSIFSISANQTWGMVASATPAYFGVHNAGLLRSTGTATIVGDHNSTSLTRLDKGTLHINGKAEQTGGTFELRGNTTIKVRGADSLLGIRSGTIVGQGTVDGNLVLGTQGGQSSGYISPGIDIIPAVPGAAPIVRGIGTLTITRAFQIFAGGMFIDIAGGGSYDKIVVQGPYAALSGLLTVYNDAKYAPSKGLTLTFLKAPSIIGDFAMRFGSYGNTSFTDTANRIIYSWKLEKTAGTYRVASYVSYRFPNPKP